MSLPEGDMGIVSIVQNGAAFIWLFLVKLFQADAETAIDHSANGSQNPQFYITGEGPTASAEVKGQISVKGRVAAVLYSIHSWAERIPSSLQNRTTLGNSSLPSFFPLRRLTVGTCLLITVMMVIHHKH